MKKQILLIAVAIFSFGVMQAQDIRFGAKVGVNFASIGGDFTDGVDGLTAFHLGGLVEIMLTDQFAIQPELLYSAQGAKQEFSETISFPGGVTITGNNTNKTKLDYIHIPIMAKYYVTEGLALEAGPQVGFLISANSEFENEFDGDVISGEEDVSEFYNGLDLGIGAGLSYRLDIGVFFSGRYVLGLSNINDSEGSDDFKQQNNVIQVSVGYSF